MISNVSSELTSSGCFISGSTPGMGGGTVTCTLLPSGSSATYLSYTPIADVTVPFQLAATVLPGSFTNTAHVSYDTTTTVSNSVTVYLQAPVPTPVSRPISVPAPVSSPISVPVTHTGEPWSGWGLWYGLDAVALAGGLAMVEVTRRRRFRKAS
jgi:hypothetical protein